jgi:hypothetical protein
MPVACYRDFYFHGILLNIYTYIKDFSMKINCKNCNKIFDNRRHLNAVHCSKKCVGIGQRIWQKSTIEEKLERLRLSFHNKYEIVGSCWLWTGAKVRRYGVIRYDEKLIKSHRASWMIFKGNIPKKLFVLHKCDIPLCVNPEHLFLGTPLDNVKDMIEKGRSKFGLNQGLGAKKIREIRKLLSENKSASEIAVIYNIGARAIRDIKNGKTWSKII